MKHYPCPRCKEEVIPLKEKFLAGHWKTIHCPRCEGRLCANIYLMAVFYLLYLWNVLWWAGLALFNQEWFYLLFIIPCWLLLDFFNVRFMPLLALRKREG